MEDSNMEKVTFALAKKFFDNGQYEDALKFYTELGKLYGNKIVDFNIQQCQEKLFKSNVLQNLNSKEEQPQSTVWKEISERDLSRDIFVGIAAIPERKDSLKKTINSLINQVSKIGVYLNNWSEIPDFLLNNPKIIVAGFQDVDLGDVGKFYWVDDFKGIYFTCDDDLIYPSDYIKKTIERLEHYKFNAAVGWHGSLLLGSFEKYYNSNSRRVFAFSSHRPHDTCVHILGTGCSAFHTQKLPIKKNIFKYPNMADIFFSIAGQQHNFPFYIIKHEQNEIVEASINNDNSISMHSIKDEKSKKNTHDLQNKFIRDNMPWVQNIFEPLKILIIGRFKNYTKGGIFKSCHLIEKTLSSLGHIVYTLDTQESLDDGFFKDHVVDLCWIYPGDPERPDYETVNSKISLLQRKRIPVLVNMSYLYDDKRTRFIAQSLIKYNSEKQSPVFAAVFTETAAQDPLLREVQKYVCVVPKTLEPTPYEYVPTFSEREGICLGDATKLGNPKIIGGNVHPWIEAIYRKMPHVNLYAYKQYQGQNPPHPKIKFVPHMKENFGEWLAHRRIFLCLNVHLTFEMVACEAQLYGTPTIYRHMPHSLSEYISAKGIVVRTPAEMAEMVLWLYNSQHIWDKLSRSSISNATANHIDQLGASLEGYLRLVMHRALYING